MPCCTEKLRSDCSERRVICVCLAGKCRWPLRCLEPCTLTRYTVRHRRASAVTSVARDFVIEAKGRATV
eukprot:4516198-Prymnesium_polylepis.1